MSDHLRRNGAGHLNSKAEPANGSQRPVLITGGTGFVGTNLADRLLRTGHPVVLLDNLSRSGVDQNGPHN